MHKTTYRLETENCQPAQIGIFIARLMRTQDLEAWKADPAGLNRWLRAQVARYMQHVSVIITTRAQ